MEVNFDGKGFIEVSSQGVLDRFMELIASYIIVEEGRAETAFNDNLTAYGLVCMTSVGAASFGLTLEKYGLVCMTSVGILLSSATVYNHMQDQIGVILSSLYSAVQYDLNRMAKEYKEKPTLHFNDMMKKFS